MDIVVKLTQEYIDKVSEHVDSVRVFITERQNGETTGFTQGNGSFFAQKGQIDEWLIRERERTRLAANEWSR